MERQWSYHRPVMAGWYWWQSDADHPPECVELSWKGGRWVWRGLQGDYDDAGRPHGQPHDGRWSGLLISPGCYDPWPVQPPQQDRPTEGGGDWTMG